MEKHPKPGGTTTPGSASIALPGQKLVTSKKLRMLTPSEAVNKALASMLAFSLETRSLAARPAGRSPKRRTA